LNIDNCHIGIGVISANPINKFEVTLFTHL
jgi:hypothetical protein